jgi:RIO kinase 1
MMNPLDTLLHDGVIDEVIGRLKSGKEADVYLVNRGGRVVAAKVYKDRAQRSFKNNAEYKEGRKVRNSRTQRAIDAGSRFGRAAAEDAWKGTEATALSRLYAHGVRVPEPLMFYEGVLVMALVTDADGRPAPRLIDVAHDAQAARAAYFDVRAQMVRMLCCEVIHGDLSAYNILAAEAGPTIIDFPQVISPAHNNRAESFFHRDFDNVLRFLAAADPTLRAHAGDGRQIWRAYAARDLTPDFVPAPPTAEGRRETQRPRHEPRPRPAPAPPRGRQPEGRPRREPPRVEVRAARNPGRPRGTRVEAPPPRPPASEQVPPGPKRRRRRRRRG